MQLNGENDCYDCLDAAITKQAPRPSVFCGHLDRGACCVTHGGFVGDTYFVLGTFAFFTCQCKAEHAQDEGT